MPFHIALNFEDGATRIITCNAGETVLKAAYRQQVNLPMDCSDGVCGTCKCRAESGEYQQGEDYIEDALSEDEAAEGKVLTCQMVPSSDCVIAVPVPSSACKLKPATFGATIARLDQVSPSTILLELALEGGKGWISSQANMSISAFPIAMKAAPIPSALLPRRPAPAS
jgi:benzoate/toluate 1,2-dioxygenase reductase subunit